MSENSVVTRVLVMMVCAAAAAKAFAFGLDALLPHSIVEFGCSRCLVDKFLPIILCPVVGLIVYGVGTKALPMRLPRRQNHESPEFRRRLWRGRFDAAKERLGRAPNPAEIGKQMSDPNKLLSDVSSKYGAPMGRPTIAGNKEAVVRLFRVRMVDGDYDVGGAYWGGVPSEPLYAAIGDDFQTFVRAKSREIAKKKLQEDYPDLRFLR
jgi:hypothetical protein